MANEVYGEAGKNTFTIPNVVGFFSTTVNKETGVTELYKQGSFLTQQSVGTYNPSTGKFTPQANSSITQSEITRITSPEGLNAVKGAAIQTATKGGATNANKLISKNTANSQESGNAQGGSTDVNVDDELKKEAGKTRNEFSQNLKYPLSLNSQYQDIIKFKMVKFRPKPLSGTGVPSERAGQTIIGTVVLPIPAGISDTNVANWGSDEMQPEQEALANLLGAGISGGGTGAADAAGTTLSEIQQNSGEVKELFKGKFTQAVTGVNALARNKGAVSNSNMELLFQGPSLRPFSFQFKLSARSEEESKAILSIIRFFKQGMSPIRTQGQLFLKAPHTFQLEYLHKNNSHNYLNKFKECALQSFTVNYTPEGQYATFTSGAMVSYEISMQFQELEPIFNDDYGLGTGGSDRYDSEIGY